ncbi:HIRAN domain-containing protein [Kribbia dieselivorans]|uniref:HIRAN domain-containing protein n=1 Tax=Kribbia dieselivorans TaxID=331526 RepID=UPI0008397218|nr:HIRAN domain-containing protein [Kribbia dieselivorans]
MLTAIKTERLLVSRQDPITRRYQRVGELWREDGGYGFSYDVGVQHALPGLRLGQQHHSSHLFPIFAERVMSPQRSDYPVAMDQLGLPPDASPFEVLAVSGGRRTGDTYEVTPLPVPGDVTLPFLVHGIRHLTEAERARVDGLEAGQRLQLRPEPTNPVNSRALLVSDDGVRLGWVPDPLVEDIHRIMSGAHELRVERLNPNEAGFHLRLLVVLTGRLEPA